MGLEVLSNPSADVSAFVLRRAGEPGAYGELWEDCDVGEVELARIIVAPDLRGRGLGRRFARMLAERAQALRIVDVWLRVVPTNGPAIASYAAAGFQRATAAQEREFSTEQPRAYAWMRFAVGSD